MLNPGDLIRRRYRLVLPLGETAFSSVWHTEDTTRGRNVALAIVEPSKGDGNRRVRDFLAKMKFLCTLRQPNIVKVITSGRTEGDRGFAVLELLTGSPLSERLEESPPLTLSQLGLISGQALDGLAALHQRREVHGDVEPGNIFITGDGARPAVKLIGIGHGRAMARAGLVSIDVEDPGYVRSLRYASPEQARGDPDIDVRTDIFSMGMVLLEAVTGALPDLGRAPREIRLALEHPESWGLAHRLRDVPGELRHVIQHALQRDRDERYATAQEMRDALLEGLLLASEEFKNRPLPGIGSEPCTLADADSSGDPAPATDNRPAFELYDDDPEVTVESDEAACGDEPTLAEDQDEAVGDDEPTLIQEPGEASPDNEPTLGKTPQEALPSVGPHRIEGTAGAPTGEPPTCADAEDSELVLELKDLTELAVLMEEDKAAVPAPEAEPSGPTASPKPPPFKGAAEAPSVVVDLEPGDEAEPAEEEDDAEAPSGVVDLEPEDEAEPAEEEDDAEAPSVVVDLEPEDEAEPAEEEDDAEAPSGEADLEPGESVEATDEAGDGEAAPSEPPLEPEDQAGAPREVEDFDEAPPEPAPEPAEPAEATPGGGSGEVGSVVLDLTSEELALASSWESEAVRPAWDRDSEPDWLRDPSSPVDSDPEAPKRPKWWIIVAVVIGVVGVVALLLLLSGRGEDDGVEDVPGTAGLTPPAPVASALRPVGDAALSMNGDAEPEPDQPAVLVDAGGAPDAEARDAPEASPAVYLVTLLGLPDSAEVRLDGVTVSGPDIEVPSDGRDHTLAVLTDGTVRVRRTLRPSDESRIVFDIGDLMGDPEERRERGKRGGRGRRGGRVPPVVRDPGF